MGKSWRRSLWQARPSWSEASYFTISESSECKSFHSRAEEEIFCIQFLLNIEFKITHQKNSGRMSPGGVFLSSFIFFCLPESESLRIFASYETLRRRSVIALLVSADDRYAGHYSETLTNKPSSSFLESLQRSLSPSFISVPFVTSSSEMVSLSFSSHV